MILGILNFTPVFTFSGIGEIKEYISDILDMDLSFSFSEGYSLLGEAEDIDGLGTIPVIIGILIFIAALLIILPLLTGKKPRVALPIIISVFALLFMLGSFGFFLAVFEEATDGVSYRGVSPALTAGGIFYIVLSIATIVLSANIRSKTRKQRTINQAISYQNQQYYQNFN